MQKITFILLFLLASGSVKAQSNIDSLLVLWKNEKQSDSIRTKAYAEYILEKYLEVDLDSTRIKAAELLAFGQAKSYPLAQYLAYGLMGEAYDLEDKFPLALSNYKLALEWVDGAHMQETKADLLNTIGSIYGDVGNNTEGLRYFEEAIKASEAIGDTETMEMSISNIGGIYLELMNYPRALQYYERGMQLEKEMKDTIGYAESLNLIGTVLVAQGDYASAYTRINEALKIFEQLEDEEGVIQSYYYLAQVYKEEENYTLALDYFIKTIENEDQSLEPNLSVFNEMGAIYNALGNYNKALWFCKQSLALAIESGMKIEEKLACTCLYQAYRNLNNTNKALEYLERSQAVTGSLNTQATNNKLQQMELDKQMLKDSIATAKNNQRVALAHEEEVRQKNQIRNIILVLALFILIIAAGLYSRWRDTQKSKAIIEKEKERSDNLLLNILPADIAKELKEKGSADAQDFDLVSILFTDFKGFTEASEKLTAKELVNEINTCFKAFDGIMGKYNIEKIKTIGDAYMAAGGLPTPDQDAVKNTVLAGLEAQQFIINRKKAHDAANKISFEMRVGIHTGPIVAGIVGIKKFQYDIWGDTVNIASRMESSGEVNKVNVSQYTYELLKDHKEFRFEHRGKIVAKGKGEIDMWFVRLA